MKLTLELDNGARHSIELSFQPADRLKTMQDMCILLNDQIDQIQVDKNNG